MSSFRDIITLVVGNTLHVLKLSRISSFKVIPASAGIPVSVVCQTPISLTLDCLSCDWYPKGVKPLVTVGNRVYASSGVLAPVFYPDYALTLSN